MQVPSKPALRIGMDWAKLTSGFCQFGTELILATTIVPPSLILSRPPHAQSDGKTTVKCASFDELETTINQLKDIARVRDFDEPLHKAALTTRTKFKRK